jgi:D-glycero-D-manno-heptose 1,7-bisphosphate phosphatase
MKKFGAKVDGIYVCPHEIDSGCDCRKPKPGLLLQAIKDLRDKEFDVNVAKSYLIGDSEIDLLAGRSLGLKSIKIGASSSLAEIALSDLYDCAKLIGSGGLAA